MHFWAIVHGYQWKAYIMYKWKRFGFVSNSSKHICYSKACQNLYFMQNMRLFSWLTHKKVTFLWNKVFFVTFSIVVIHIFQIPQYRSVMPQPYNNYQICASVANMFNQAMPLFLAIFPSGARKNSYPHESNTRLTIKYVREWQICSIRPCLFF